MKQVVLFVVADNGNHYKIYADHSEFLTAIFEASGYALNDIEEADYPIINDVAQAIAGEGELVRHWALAKKKSHLKRLVLEGSTMPNDCILSDLGTLAAAALRDLAQTPEPPSPDIVILTDANGWPSGVFTFGDNARPLRYVLVSENDVRDGAVPASEAHVGIVDGHFKDFAAVEAEIHSRI